MKIIYGPKGTGKTKAIIELANEKSISAKGNIVFITNKKDCSIYLNFKVKFLDLDEFNVKGIEEVKGFVKGIVASNGDIEYVMIDGISQLTGKALLETKDVFDAIENLEKQFGVKFVLTCSGAKEELPDFITKFVD